MARKPRIHYPGACYHVILRGNAGNDIFLEEQDRIRFCLLLQEGVERYKHRIHAFCLMTNHVHLAIEVGEVPLSRILQNVSFRYTRFLNQRKKQTGHVFQGRYKAIILDADSYLLELIRYIHNNPVRAGIVKTAATYPWSSHAVYLGKRRVSWLTTDWVLSQFSRKKERAMELYRQFIEKGAIEGHRKEFYQGNIEGQILGDDRFAERVLAKASRKMRKRTPLAQILETVCDYYGVSRNELCSGSRQKQISECRAVLALLVRELEQLSLTSLSKELKRDLSGLSQAARRLDHRLKVDRELAKTVEFLRGQLQ